MVRIEREIEVVNKLGLHARAAALLVKAAAGYGSEIQLVLEDRQVDAKSIMGILTLAATQGSRLRLVADGEDAGVAAKAIVALFADYFGEGE